MRLFRKKYIVDYITLISNLEIGDEKLIQDFLWQPKNKIVNYSSLTTGLILGLKKDNGSTSHLQIFKKLGKGRFELIIFEVPWSKDDFQYSPLIIDKSNSKIIGVMLPFNELHSHLSNKENKAIGTLGMEWTGFVMKNKFNV